MTNKTILVTGGAGFIGSNLVERLLETKNKVVVVDDFNNFYSPERKHSHIRDFHLNKDFKLIEADIRSQRLFETLFLQYQIDSVVHLAARAGVRASLENPQLYWDVNVMGSLNLLEAMRLHKIPQLVFASSSSVYGNRSTGPFKESDNTNLHVSPYGASKKALEVLAATYSHLYGINTTGLRFFTAYGPKNRPQMACSNFVEAALSGQKITKYGDGSTGRDYTYIDDIVSGIVASLDLPQKYEIINLGNSTPVTLNELISTFEAVVGKKLKIDPQPPQPGDVEFTFASIKKAKKLLKWQPTTDLKTGLKQLVKWFKVNQKQQKS